MRNTQRAYARTDTLETVVRQKLARQQTVQVRACFLISASACETNLNKQMVLYILFYLNCNRRFELSKWG